MRDPVYRFICRHRRLMAFVGLVLVVGNLVSLFTSGNDLYLLAAVACGGISFLYLHDWARYGTKERGQ